MPHAPPTESGPPSPAPRVPVRETYWGTEVLDPFRNLEATGSPDVRAWVEEQDARARRRLESHPARAAIEQHLSALTRLTSPLYFAPRVAGRRTFFLEKHADREQAALVVFDDLRDSGAPDVVVDPARVDLSGRTAIDWFVPSPNGRMVAVSFSSDGTEAGTLRVFDTESGTEIGSRIPGASSATAGGSAAWDEDGRGFFYTRHPAADGSDAHYFDQRVYYHEIGDDPADDPMVLGEGFSRLAKIRLSRAPGGSHHLARVEEGDGGARAFWLRAPEGTWRRIAAPDDEVVDARFGRDRALYVLSRRGAPTGAVLRMPLSAETLDDAELVVPAGETIIHDFAVTATRIYVVEMFGGPMRIQSYTLSGVEQERIEMSELAGISGLVTHGSDEILFRHQSYTEPPAWFLLSPARRRPARTALVHRSPASFEDVEVRREHAYADDGTAIPITVLLPKNLLRDGHAPALLRGYGAYGLSLAPSFDPSVRLWIAQGGVYAVANVRGGGELGEAWHEAATGERKKRSIDDFAACARHLVAAGYSSPERVAVEGGSAGGLLAYATMVLYPDRMAAAIAHAPVADVLRNETTPNGAFNVPEFGTVEDEAQFTEMWSYSPYHNVVDGRRYPPVLSLVGLNDVRVAPWHAFKMTARLHEAGDARALLLVNGDAGHAGAKLTDGDRRRADAFTFLLQELGLPFRAPGRIAVAD